MAIPAARAIEFGEGVSAVKMHGSEHNDSWGHENGNPTLSSDADGALGGFSTGAPLKIKVHFKPPSSISKTQTTLNIKSGSQEELVVDDSGRPQHLPWEDWRPGEDQYTSEWMRVTSPSGSASYQGQIQWAGELGYGIRPSETGQSSDLEETQEEQ